MGFMVVDRVAVSLSIGLEKEKFKSLWGESRINNDRLILIKPQTYMNVSGVSVRQWVMYYRLHLKNTLIVHDDLDLEPGALKFVHGGGSGGHKGIESITRELGERDFPHLKVGIGRPRYGELIEDFVLSSFYSDQKELMDSAVDKAAEAAETWVREGISKAMNIFN